MMASSRFVPLVVFFLWCIADSFQDDFANQVLKAHNNFRKIHNAPALSLDDKMSKKATALAKKLRERGNMLLQKGDSGGYGVNFSFFPKMDVNGYKAVVSWYKEVCQNDNFKKLKDFTIGNAGRFTQVVWKGSKKIGVGTEAAKLGGRNILYVTVLYDPAGNLLKKGKENVLRGNFNEGMCKNLLKVAKGN